MTRDWSAMRAKVDREGRCRVCASRISIEAAHIIPRSRSTDPIAEHELNCCPLCPLDHLAYDRRQLDLLPHLSTEEQAHAVLVAGGLVNAFERVTSERWST